MPAYLHRTTKAYRTSVSTIELPEPVANYIQDPDMSAVTGQPSKYWTITGDVVSLLDQTARDTVDAQEAADKVAAHRLDAKSRMDQTRDSQSVELRALAKVILGEFNILRAAHSLAPRTWAQMVSVVKSKIDSGGGEA